MPPAEPSDREAYLEEQIARQKRGEPVDVDWVRAAAESGLGRLSGEEAAALIRQARDAEVGDRREALDRALRSLR